MSEQDRKIHAQELMAVYAERATKLTLVAHRMAEKWVERQAEHLQSCADDLEWIRDTGDLP